MKKAPHFIVVFSLLLSSCTQFKNLNPNDLIARAAIQVSLPLLQGYYDRVAPLAPSSRSVLPTITMAEDNWELGYYRVNADGSLSLSPGEFAFPVMTFCMKSSAGSPSGHLYKLSTIQGSRAGILRDLHTRGTAKKYSTGALQMASWAIQSGAKFEGFGAARQKIIRDLVPEHIPALKKSSVEQLREQWDRIANLSDGKIPTFNAASDSLLDSLGEFGEGVRDLRRANDEILRQATSYETYRQRILQPPSEEKGTLRNTPWSVVSKGVYARLVTQNSFNGVGMLQVRVAPEAFVDTTPLKGNLASLSWVPSLMFLFSKNATAEQPAQCTSGPGAEKPFDPGKLQGDPGNGGIQPLAMGMAPPIPAPNPALAAAALAAALAAMAAAMAAGNWDPQSMGKALDQVGKDIAAGNQKVDESIKEYYEKLRRWYQTRTGEYQPPPKELPAYPGLEKTKPKGGRPRWVDGDGKIYEWDGEKGELEKYDARGKNHEGGFDPVTGKQRSPAKPGRCTPK